MAFLPWKNINRFMAKFLKQPGYALKVAARRLKAYVYYYAAGGRAPRPEAITLFLTYRCNLRCKMCGQWGEGGVTRQAGLGSIKEELKMPEFKKFIDDAGSFKPNITLFGGEPFLYNGIIELISYIKSKKMHCLVVTNGFMLDDLAQEIIACGLDELNVSLDGPEQLHDEIRGMPGLFRKITGGLKTIHSIKKERKIKKPFVNLQCTITEYNYGQLESMLDVARDAGADSLTFHHLIFLEEELIQKQKSCAQKLSCSWPGWNGFVSKPKIDPRALADKIKKISRAKDNLKIDFYPNLSPEEIANYYTNPDYKPREYPSRCVSPWICAYVFPDGEVKPCLNSTYSFGNIRDNRFAGIWNSPGAVNFRKILKSENIFPCCVRCTELYRY